MRQSRRAAMLRSQTRIQRRYRARQQPVGHQRTRGLAVALPAHLLERCERQALFDLRQLGLQIIPYAARAIATPQFAPQTACRSFG